jgi:hypothetical protein
MARARPERNRAILRLRRQGMKSTRIAAQNNITCSRVSQIVAAHRALDERRTALEAEYGRFPDVASLSDDTPIDVLMLCNTTAHGWVSRIRSLCKGSPPMVTLGDLRHLPDAQLLSRPGVGAGLFARLRALCPPASRRTDARKRAKEPVGS